MNALPWRHAFLLALMRSANVASAAGVKRDADAEPPSVPESLHTWAKQQPDAADLEAQLQAAYSKSTATLGDVANVAVLLGDRDPRAAELLRRLDDPVAADLFDPPAWIGASTDAKEGISPPEDALPAALRNNLALLVAGKLHANRYYEECLAWLAGVDASETVAPVLVYYYRAVSHHQLVELEAATLHAERVLEASAQAGRRHVTIAKLIVRDTQAAEPDSPGYLARSMNDIDRRLRLGRTADPEQQLQQEVIDALDKMIEDAEKQQQQQQQQQAAGSRPSAPSTPMQESQPGDMKGPGDVDRREIATGGDWGSLPPQERDRVTQQIGRDFPAYYREVIEAYFQSLATEEAVESADGP
ncbi:MAG: hypothetical protein AAGF31_04820 [Planctomycetota bacterium]